MYLNYYNFRTAIQLTQLLCHNSFVCFFSGLCFSVLCLWFIFDNSACDAIFVGIQLRHISVQSECAKLMESTSLIGGVRTTEWNNWKIGLEICVSDLPVCRELYRCFVLALPLNTWLANRTNMCIYIQMCGVLEWYCSC